MLRELNVVEQRYQAVLEVLGGTPVTEVALRFGSPPVTRLPRAGSGMADHGGTAD
jgi:hypothetical protein